MGLKKTDSAPILRTPAGEIIWHALFSVSKERGGELVSSQCFRTVRRPRPHSAWVAPTAVVQRSRRSLRMPGWN